MTIHDALVIGAGHNGLTCACYLARAGLRVLVVEMAGRIGGATNTEATIAGLPDYRFDTHSVVHNMIRMTTVLEELDLAGVGLRYVETDPFLTTFFPDGAAVRLFRSADATCDEIARYAPDDAEAYRRFIRAADPVVELGLAAFRSSADSGSGAREWGKRLTEAAKALRWNGPIRLAATLAGPYGPLLDETFRTEYARVGIAAMAAHGTLGPDTPGAAFFVLWQAAYHRYGNWHAIGGSGALSQALAARLADWGGEVRTGARVTRILAGRRVRGVQLANGERIAARRVIAAINPQTALLDLLGPDHLTPRLAARLRARYRPNAVQFIVNAALSRPIPWPNAPAGSERSLQSVGASVDQFRANFRDAEAGIAPEQPAAYVYTLSSLDPTVAPAGGQTAYLACAAYPARFREGIWTARAEGEAHRLVQAIEARAPGFESTIQGLSWRHAEDWERENGLLGGHPMHLAMTLDQLGPFRPLPELANHRAPLPGLYLSGAGTSPTGGVSAVPGRAAAKAVLRDLG